MITPQSDRDVPAWDYRFQARAQELSLDLPGNLCPSTSAFNEIGSLAAYQGAIQGLIAVGRQGLTGSTGFRCLVFGELAA